MNKNRSPIITLAHGNGGRHMRELIEEVFHTQLQNPLLNTNNDAAALPSDEGELIFTSDSFTVKPLEFPGGSIGSLAIHGTVNDLAVSGAIPHYLSLNALIEEGMPIAQLKRIVTDLAQAASACGVQIVTGDTKVIPRGEGSGLYLTTSGIGRRPSQLDLGMHRIQPGDKILINGSIGDHGSAVMLAREAFGLSGKLLSDSASVLPYTQTLHDLPGLHFMRDPTRGGLATVCNEITHNTRYGIQLLETHIPIKKEVRSICDMLGYDPYYLACEGRVITIVAAEDAEQALQRWQAISDTNHAAIIGEIITGDNVILETALGGRRIMDELEDDPLPRIC